MAMNNFKLISKHFSKLALVWFCYLGQSLGCETIDTSVGSLLHAALQEHGAQFLLLLFSDVQLEELVAAVLEVN